MKKSLVFILLALALQACSSGGGGGGGGSSSSNSNGGQDNLSDIQWSKVGDTEYPKVGDTKFPVTAAFDGTNFYYIDGKTNSHLRGGPGGILDATTSPELQTLPPGSTDFQMKFIGPDLFLRFKENGVDKILQKTAGAPNDGWQPVKNLIDFSTEFNLLTTGSMDGQHYYNFNSKGTASDVGYKKNLRGLYYADPADGIFYHYAGSVTQPNFLIFGTKVLLLGYIQTNGSNLQYPAFYETGLGGVNFTTAYKVQSDASSEIGFLLKGIAFGNGTYLAGIEAADKSKVALLKSTDLRKWEKVKTISAKPGATLELKGVEFQPKNSRFVSLVDETLAGQNSCWVRIYNQDFSQENEKQLIATNLEKGGSLMPTKCFMSYTGIMNYAEGRGSGLMHAIALEVTEPDKSVSLKFSQSR